MRDGHVAASSASLTKLVGELVLVRASHGDTRRCRAAAQAERPRRKSVAERGVLDAVLAAHLLHHQLRVRDDLDRRQLELDRAAQPGDQAAVLGDVVRRDADRLAFGREHGAVVGLEHEPVGGGAWVAARAAVGEELDGYCSTLSICARCSLPL